MARVKICEVCHHRNTPTERICKGELDNGKRCEVPIGGVPITEDSDQTSVSQEVEAARSVAESTPADRNLVQQQPFLARTTRETPKRQARVEFPWGPEVVAGCLAIGRDWEFSPLADRLQATLAVSRRHAELSYDGERLIVRHLGENNPTYVQGRPLATGDSLELADGDDVAFSLDLKTKVRIG